MAAGKTIARSTAQRQSDYRRRLKLRNPELLRERERRKWRQRQMKRRLTLQPSTLQNAEASCNRANPLVVEMKHREMPFLAGNSNDMGNSCPRRMHLVDETTYRNYIQQVDRTATRENHPIMENCVSSLLRNAELEEIFKCFLLELQNNWIKDKNSESSPAITSPECACDMSSERTKTARSSTCEMGVMNVSTMKTNKMTKRNAKPQRKKRVVPILWDPI